MTASSKAKWHSTAVHIAVESRSQSGAALDVGEEEGHGAGWEIGHDPLQSLGGTWCCPIVAREENTLADQAEIVDAFRVLGTASPCYAVGKPSPSRFRESQRPCPMMRWSSSSISSNCPAATISTVSATSAAEGVGSPDGWLWTATRAVACWRTASRKTSVLRRKRAASKSKRHDKGTARQTRRATIFLVQALADPNHAS
jgi:hypothetical protein